ncbi:MAG: ATP-binding protein [Candidatus Cloacimonetes bacterium]|nr:ATP-binding protein [Candidatus Cloacimonadota bacterium]
MDISAIDKEIARVRFLAEKKYLTAIVNLVNQIARNEGFAAAAAGKLELAAEEACLNIIDHAYGPDEQGHIELICQRKPGELIIAIQDKGLPFDFRLVEGVNSTGLGSLLMKALVDQVRFLNLGSEGKRLELVKRLPGEHITLPVEKDIEAEPVQEVIQLQPGDYTIRLMTENDVLKMSQCIYHAYGYTYGWEFVYYPERMKEMLNGGMLTSVVTELPDQTIIGHLAMLTDAPEARVGETGMAVVVPRYRKNSLFPIMKKYMIEVARQRGMLGIFSEAITAHPFSQKGNISIGARETGILLGLMPPMQFKKVRENIGSDRVSAVLYYLRINPHPIRRVYPPAHHRTIISRIYQHIGLDRELAESHKPKDLNQSSARVNIDIKPEICIAYLRIVEYGEDITGIIRLRLRELCLRKLDTIYLDLPLSKPETAFFCASFEQEGFFFAGLIPELQEGDVLRLQYLNNILIDRDKLDVCSEFGQQLLDYIYSNHNRRS